MAASQIAKRINVLTQQLVQEEGGQQQDPLVALKQRELDLKAMDIQMRAQREEAKLDQNQEQFEDRLDFDEEKNAPAKDLSDEEKLNMLSEVLDVLEKEGGFDSKKSLIIVTAIRLKIRQKDFKGAQQLFDKLASKEFNKLTESEDADEVMENAQNLFGVSKEKIQENISNYKFYITPEEIDELMILDRLILDILFIERNQYDNFKTKFSKENLSKINNLIIYDNLEDIEGNNEIKSSPRSLSTAFVLSQNFGIRCEWSFSYIKWISLS